MGKALRNLWYNYRSEVVFGAVMVVVVVLSSYLARFIPDTVYDTVLTPLFNIATFTAALPVRGSFSVTRRTCVSGACGAWRC